MQAFYNLLADDRVTYYGVVAINCVLLLNLFFWGWSSCIIIALGIICGYYVFDHIFNKQYSNDCLQSKNIYNKTSFNNYCKDYVRPNINIKCVIEPMPWKGLFISEQIDCSIDKLLSKIIQTFIASWYENISNDPNLIKEIKLVIRFATSNLLKRLLQLNIEDIVYNKILPIFLSHIRHCQKIEKGEQIPRHFSISNRKVEIMYLQKITSNVLPFITRENDNQCKIFYALLREILSLWVLLPISDVICNPVNLVSALLKLSKSSTTSQVSTDEQVEFLSKFISEDDFVQLGMRSIFKDPTILSAFMNFLKQKEAMHLLQFCLNVDQFNKRMLRPEIPSHELDILYRDAWDIYSVYFSKHSPDCIHFEPGLVNQLRKDLSKDVIKLQNSKPLNQAYEQIYCSLENKYWIAFQSSDEYFSWIFGSRNISKDNSSQKPCLNKEKNSSSIKMSRKLNRIKGALKSSVIYDGQVDSLSSDFDTEFGEDLSVDSDIINSERDLNTWKVIDVTSAVKLESGSNGGQSLVFFITVETVKNDIIKQWCVERRTADFYTLKSKLTEFHGVILDVWLPPKRVFGQKTENNEIFMHFLNQLLNKSELRRSDLLHMFLTSTENFEDSESAIGRLLRKSMPMALRKERGQNLESFISVFMTSVETKLKQKHEWKDLFEGIPQRKSRSAENPIFSDYTNILNDQNDETVPVKDELDQINIPCGPMDCIIFFGAYAYNMSNTVIRLILAIQFMCGNILNYVIQKYISSCVVKSITPSKISNLIELLENLLFSDGDANNENHKISAENILSLNNSFLQPLYMCLYKCSQNSIMNKQLFYRLLDVLIEELFPELRTQPTEQL